MENKVALLDFEGNTNIGLFMFANDKFALLGKEVDEKKKKEITAVLNVPVYTVSVMQTDLVGIFLTGNNEFVLCPQIPEYEQKILVDICSEHDTKIFFLNHNLNTYGNSICVGSKKILCSSEYEQEFLDEIKKETGIVALPLKKKEFSAIGGLCFHVKDFFYLSQEIEESEVKSIKKDVVGVGTVNSGGLFVSSGLIANKNGILIGSGSSTVEIQNIVETLEYL